jgi:DNA-binding XRE family transcriptional regulator
VSEGPGARGSRSSRVPELEVPAAHPRLRVAGEPRRSLHYHGDAAIRQSAVDFLLVSDDVDPSILFRRRFGRRLRVLRLERDLTQQQLADAAGFDRTFIGKLERDESGVNVDRLDDLARALGLTVRDLLPKDDS